MNNNKPFTFWISGWNHKASGLKSSTTITVFVTADDPHRAEAFVVVEKSWADAEIARLKAEMLHMLEMLEMHYRKQGNNFSFESYMKSHNMLVKSYREALEKK